ncbi:ABC transporter permease [Paenibacillus sanguinis]|uniref:ABC transporter permease n=1 Tax=Paenibacillus sanguinis TaxID=225906 RepID=UPI000366CD03|nr:ABC transporter permease [Paenibacillus sanguinis]
MKHFMSTLGVEVYKLRRSLVPWLTLLFLIFIVSQEVGKADWQVYLQGATYKFVILGSVGFGFLTSWLYGREYADRTIKDLLSLPVSRINLVLAKYATVIIACFLITIAVFIYALGLGAVAQLPHFSWNLIGEALGAFALTSLFSVLLCTVVALLASLSRGWLAPIGFVFLTLILALSLGSSAAGPYIPWAMPTLQTLPFTSPGSGLASLNWISYLILAVTGAGGLIGTMAYWRYADQR